MLTILIILGVLLLVFAVVFLFLFLNKKNKIESAKYIRDNIPNMYFFLDGLSETEKEDFYSKVELFIESHTFTGIATTVTLKDKILIASGLVMMLFRTKVSFLGKIGEVFLSEEALEKKIGDLPHRKSSNIRKTQEGFDIFINRKELNYGFENLEDNKNLLLHQFAHILDGMDGEVDGLPNLLLPSRKIAEWNLLAKEHMAALELEDTLQNRYVQKKRSEYFATVTEHYFENPKDLAQKSPKIYDFLDKIYQGGDFE